MWQYILKRLLLMIPTILGITIVGFLIMRIAPGDPLQFQLGQLGVVREGSITREQFKIMKKQFHLDKPLILNFEMFKSYSKVLDFCVGVLSMSQDSQLRYLTGIRDKNLQEDMKFMEDIGIKQVKARLFSSETESIKSLAKSVQIGAQLQVENIGRWGVKYLIEKLEAQPPADKKIGIIKALNLMVDEPFIYTTSPEAKTQEVKIVKSTWLYWWQHYSKEFKPVSVEREGVLSESFSRLLEEKLKMAVLEETKKYLTTDAPFFIEKLKSSDDLKTIYLASLALRMTAGKPLPKDVNITDMQDAIDKVCENWMAHYGIFKHQYEPGMFEKILLIFTDTQYFHYAKNLFTFNFGNSLVGTQEPVGKKIWHAVIVSAPLIFFAEIIIYLLAIPSGIICAVYRGKFWDRSISLVLFMLYSIPSFWAAMIFLTFLCSGRFLAIFPLLGLHSQGYEDFDIFRLSLDYLWHIVLPVTCSLFGLAGLAMYSRTCMLEVINQDYVRTARAKGVPEIEVILKHALRNGLIPVITLFASFIPALLGGSVIIESLFGIPGMGRLSFDSLIQRDYTTLLALIYIDALIVMACILLTDILYVIVDPRIDFAKVEVT